ncbi:hypothetical protein VTP01DRAFT_4868 [Rhizomucor pusillus]|uniref:uncharacterized protein n=1 Tax=Rhizomucor pusillus TaxID=4840 RepID=UPI0037439726
MNTSYYGFKQPVAPDMATSKGLECEHCVKAQLSCDGARPCINCFKRGLSTTCVDATRKKSKQQQEEDTTSNSAFLYDSVPSQHAMDQFLDTSQLLNFSLADLGFGSETAGLEYGIIGNMLQNPLDGGGSDGRGALSFPVMPPPFSYPQTTTTSTTTTAALTTAVTASTATTAAAATAAANMAAAFSNLLPLQQQQQQLSSTLPEKSSPPTTTMKRDSMSSTGSGSHHPPTSIRRKHATPEAVYNSVRRPFNYAEGFHYLIQYVKEKMGREDLKRISRALALFRPSFLALIMNLTEEDLVFMEKCMQRTLLEYEKLISFSGTPTVVWRRTGEICLVGKEFSLLTQWQRDTLLGKKTYIYELMDNESAVEYWEKFSTHAFDNTDKACILSCILRTPSHKPVPCTFCFTIKRDIFDLPSVIIGNFLPLLS